MQIHKKFRFSLIVLLLASLVGGFLASRTARAAGETYTWRDPQTIEVSGGDLQGTTAITLMFIVPPVTQANQGTGTVMHESGCVFQLRILTTSDTTGTITGLEGLPSFNDPNGPAPPPLCSSAIYSTYTGNITFTNSRSGTTEANETQSQRTITIQANYNGTPDSAPNNIQFTIRPTAGGAPKNVTLTKYAFSEYGAQNISFRGNTTLEPGTYTGCDSLNIGCNLPINKIKFQPLSLVYGMTVTGGRVTVQTHVILTDVPVDQAINIPGVSFTLTPQGSQQARTLTSQPINLPVSSLETQAAGSGSRKDVDTLVSVVFDDVSPGTYTVCVQGTSNCKTVVKGNDALTVDLNSITGQEAQQLVDSSSEDEGPTCEGSIDNGFGWLICPILSAADGFLNKAQEIIEKKLVVDQDYLSNDALFKSWATFARISSILLVLIALVMIISTALGFGIFDAYTVKKILPKLVIAAIGIWLSWPLITVYIDFMNSLGQGIAGLMFAPFSAAYSTPTDPVTFNSVDLEYIVTTSMSKSGVITDLSITTLFSVGLVSLALGAGGILGVIAILIPVVGAMFIGLFLLSLRQVLIILCVVLAPLAIAAWILPNTNKMWKLWSGTLNKLLLLFPLFMGTFAAAKIFALISAKALSETGDPGFMELIIPMIVYVAPFFLIPTLFKFAGTIFGNLTGIVNNRSKGIFDRGKQAVEKRKAISNRELAKKQREASRVQRRQRDFAAGLAATGIVGGKLAAARRLRAGGLSSKNRRDVYNTAMATSRAAADKELEATVGGDADVLSVVAAGSAEGFRELRKKQGKTSAADVAETESIIKRAESQVGTHLGDRNSQAAALQRISTMGLATKEHFDAVAEAYKDDATTANIIINGAAYASRSAGNITAGSLKYNFETKEVDFGKTKDITGATVDHTAETAVIEKLRTMKGADFASLRVKYDAYGGVTFTDDHVTTALLADPVFAKTIFEDKTVELSSGARDALLKLHGATPSAPGAPPAPGTWYDPRTRA